MTKYMILLNCSEPSSEQMTKATPEQMQASMQEWIAWKDQVEQQGLKFDFGSPMQAASHIAAEGAMSPTSQAAGYFMLEADSLDAVTSRLGSHPHMKRDGATIDVLEFLRMPGVSHQ